MIPPGSARANLQGAALMVASMACFALNDTMMKSLAGHVPLGQAIALRGVVTVVVLGLWAARRGQLRLPVDPGDRRVILWRSLGEIGAVVCFLTALFHLPIAIATAILQMLPLTVALGAALFYREPLGWRRLTAIAVGLVGVLIIIRPQGKGVDPYMLLVLGAVAAVTLRDLATRRLSATVPGLTVAFWGAVGVTAVGFAMSLGGPWVRPGPLEAATLMGAAGAIMAAYLLSIATVRVGDMAFAAPFRYSGVLWALLLGLVVFGEWPDPLSLAGVVLVVGSGAFTLWRAHMRARRAG